MDLPPCLFSADGALTLGLCKPLGLGFADWAKLVGISLAALLTWLYRSILIPVVKWPINALRPRNKNSWPRISNEQGHADRAMVGREGVLQRLREILVEGNPAAITNNRKGIAAVRGFGGIGKTFTAYNYLSRYRSSYEVIWVVPAETIDSLHESLIQLGERLGQPFDPKTDLKLAALQALHQASRLGNPVLVVFDNVVAPRDIQAFLIEPGRVHYLITSRHDDWSGIAYDFPLGLLGGPAAVELLRSEADRGDPGLEILAEDLGRLPLALVIAGAYLRANAVISIAEYRNSLIQRLEDAPINVEYDRSIYASVITSYERVGDKAQFLANFCAFISPDDIDLEFIWAIITSAAVPALGLVAADRSALSQEFAKLRSAALLERVDKASPAIHSMHRLTGAVIRYHLERNKTYGQWASAASQAVLMIMPSGSLSNPEVWPYCVRPLAHIASLVEHGAPPTEEGCRAFTAFLSRAADYLDARGDYATAIDYLKLCRSVLSTFFGEGSIQYGKVTHHLGTILARIDRLDEAEQILKQALTIARQNSSTNDSVNTAAALMGLAQIYWERNQFEKGEPLLVEARDMVSRTTGKESMEYAIVTGNLGSVYGEWGRLNDALKLGKEASTLLQRTVGPVHPELANLYRALAGYYAKLKDWKPAVDYASRALVINLLLGLDNHPSTTSKFLFLVEVLSEAKMNSELKSLRDDLSGFLQPIKAKILDEQKAHAARQGAKPD
jgi:tetratricopeptide (TPR) repeat protein